VPQSGDGGNGQENARAIETPRLPGWRGRYLPSLIGVAGSMVIIGLWFGVRLALAESSRTLCLTNERRISSALLLYCQDHDGCLPPPEYPAAPRGWRHWFGLLEAYLPSEEPLLCPKLDVRGAKSPRGYEFATTYALNERFFGRFGPGPFPLENLELPANTAMLVEAGAWWFPGRGTRAISPQYFDTVASVEMFPAPHGGKMNVAAADGHVVSVKPAHYGRDGHDPLLGRLGGTVYNWNGGHPNGDTGGAPRE
jgi:prepilin-type processing-associated H-X9-DG protein